MIYHYEDKKIWILKVDNFIQMMILVEISETIIIKDEFILNQENKNENECHIIKMILHLKFESLKFDHNFEYQENVFHHHIVLNEKQILLIMMMVMVVYVKIQNQ